jgi:hypothetical protein
MRKIDLVGTQNETFMTDMGHVSILCAFNLRSNCYEQCAAFEQHKGKNDINLFCNRGNFFIGRLNEIRK